MKKVVLFSLLTLNSMTYQENKQPDSFENNTIKANNTLNTPVYTIKISSANPYEVFVNDMPLEKDYTKESSTIELPINDLLLTSGKQNIRIRIFPDLGAKTVDQSDLDYFDLKIYKYQSIYSVGSGGDLIKEINLKGQKEMPIVDKSQFVDIEVPYKVTGWSGSVDLSKENQNTLKKEVLLKYNELREIINEGDLREFLSQNKVRDKEVYKVFYNDKDFIAEDEKYLESRISKSKNNMIQIYDYHVKIYGNGKVIALEKNDGKSALYADDSSNMYYYVVLLHRPKQGGSLEVIR